jgi:uncharacterized repeat protein (TIGR01451 family)
MAMSRKRIDHRVTQGGSAASARIRPTGIHGNLKRPVAWLAVSAASLLFSVGAAAAESCSVDDAQADFLQGSPSSVAVLSSGDVVLAPSDSIDQQNVNLSANGFTFHSYHWFGQTFTAGKSGPLSSVDIRLFCNSCTGTTPDITVSIRATDGGAPTGEDLATATIPGFSSATGQFFKAIFDSPLNVNSGTMYAILVRANANPSAGSYAYLTSSADPYSGGTRLTSTTSGVVWSVRDYDVGFRTYIGSGYANNGSLVSSLKDANPPQGSNPTWTGLSWNGTAPGNTTLRFQAAGSNITAGPFVFVGPDGTAGSYFTSSGASLSQFNGFRYLKYKAVLSTTNPAATPVLDEATICHDNVAPASADLQVTKTNGTSSTAPGSQTTYTIVASNAGPSNVSSATVSDNFNADLQSCSWTCSAAGGASCGLSSGNGNINRSVNLPANGSVTFSASCNVAAGASGSLVNTATVSSATADPVPGNNSATDSDALSPSADLGITKTNGTSSSTPGGQTTYTIVASNAGPSNVASATVADTFNSSLENCSWTCNAAGGASCGVSSGSGNINRSVNLPANGSVTFSASCSIAAGASGSLVNTATVSSATPDPVPGNNSATDADSLNVSANLSITKSNGTGTSTPGAQTSYTIVASNAGPSNVSNATVTDTFPADLENCSWTCSGSGGGSCAASGTGSISQPVNLPVGASATFVASCGIKPTATGSISNTATISSSTPDPEPANNSATDADNLAASADLGITKTNGTASSTPGGQTTYTIVASNAGPSNVSNATVSDTFATDLQNCSWTCNAAGGASCGVSSGSGHINRLVNLPVNGSVTFSASCDVSPSATGSLVNTATVSSATSDPVPGNNSATDTDTLGASADLGITKTNGTSSSTPGGQTTYTIVASNAGPSNVASATVADTFNSSLENCSWTCNAAGGASCGVSSGSGNINRTVSLPANGSVTFSASCNVAAGASGSLVNTATVASATPDPVPGNNSATDTDSLGGSANLGISKTNGTSSSTPGTQTTYTIVASNAGPSNVASATVTDAFNSNLQNCSWTCGSAGGASCGVSSGSGSINRSVNLPVNGSVTFSATCTIKSTATGSLVNTASISAPITDPVPGNNSATDTDTLSSNADLAVSLSNEQSAVIAGESVIYTLVASNSGPSAVTNALVSDAFPNKLRNCEWICEATAGGSCASAGNGNINQNVNLPAHGSATFTAICDVDEVASGSLVNSASVAALIPDPVAGNNNATDTDTISYVADLGISLQKTTADPKPGQPVNLTMTASNAGSSAVSQVTVQSAFPAELTQCTWTCQAGSGASCPASGSGNVNHTVNLPKGTQVNYSATCVIAASASGSLVSTAQVSAGIDDPDPNNNHAMETIDLDVSEDLIFKNSFD